MDHLDTTAFLIHQHSRLFALNKLLVPLVLPLNLILIHLRVQVGLVFQKHVASLGLHRLLLLLFSLLTIHNRQVLLTRDPSLLLKLGIDVCELLLAPLMKILEVSLMLCLLLSLLCP